jgi:hypothetical protein
MAPALSRSGSINGAVSTYDEQKALFLKKFSGEVLTAFQRRCRFKDLVQTRTIDNGKSAQFIVTGRLKTETHTPGSEITGNQQLAQNEAIINIDDYLYSAVALDSLDEAMAHWNIRQVHSTEIGEALARAWDKRCARVLTLAARISSSDLTANLPSGLSPDQQARTGYRIELSATNATLTADDYVASVFAAATKCDEKDWPEDRRIMMCSPEVYNVLIQSSRAVNQDWNQQGANGSYSKGQIAELAGFTIMKSNHLYQGNVTTTGERGFTFGGTTVSQSTVDMRKTRMLAFHPDAVGAVCLKGITTSMTGNDYDVVYNAVLMKGQYACGFGILRPELAIEIYHTAGPDRTGPVT